MSQQKPHLFCFGLGYTALRLAKELIHEGWNVSGTIRDKTRFPDFIEQGITPYALNSNEPESTSKELPLDTATHILSSVPPGAAGDPIVDIVSEFPPAAWVGYLSTTGVYGNTDGKLVDETSPLQPSTERGRRRVQAEKQWMALSAHNKQPIHIFRLPGIYGPTRCAFDLYRKNKLKHISKPGHLFNRVHVDDIVQALKASIKNPKPGQIYNVCDDHPSEPALVIRYACELMGVEPPPMVTFEDVREKVSAIVLSFWQDERLVSNERLKSELGVTLLYPDYKTGLRSIWDAEIAFENETRQRL